MNMSLFWVFLLKYSEEDLWIHNTLNLNPIKNIWDVVEIHFMDVQLFPPTIAMKSQGSSESKKGY